MNGNSVRFRLESSTNLDTDDEDSPRSSSRAPAKPSSSGRFPKGDIEYYYSRSSGSQLVQLASSTKSKNGLTPVAEVAPRLPTADDAEVELEDDGKVFRKEIDRKRGGKHNRKMVVVDDGASSSVPRPSTAEIFVALWERRRSLAIAETDGLRRKSLGRSLSTTESLVETQPIDPLRANIQMLSECFTLIKRNRRQLLMNIFLILLVALILSSMIVFAFLAPPAPAFDLVLAPWITFWPLNMRLTVYQLGRAEDSLSLTLGKSNFPFARRPPSYCQCPEDASGATSSCWCFDWHGQARLYMSVIRPEGIAADCLVLDWRTSTQQRVQVADCFGIAANPASTSTAVRWYGGPLRPGQSWPINANVTTPSGFVPYLVDDPQTNPSGMYGAAEPLWISDNGFAVMVSLDNPFSTSLTESSVCLNSTDLSKAPLKYMVCRADDSRTFTLNVSSLSSYVTSEFPERSPDDDDQTGGLLIDQSPVVGTIFFKCDSSTITVERIRSIQNATSKLKYDKFGIVMERFDLYNQTMIDNVLECLAEVTTNDSDGTPGGKEDGGMSRAIEINNFVKFHHFEENGGDTMARRCVSQSEKKTIGVSEWRSDIYACLDFTRTDVSEWFVDFVANHSINNSTDYLSFAGGDAYSLPIMPNLNLTSTSQVNFYSTLYSRAVASIPKSILTDVAYGNHRTTTERLLINLPMSSDDVRSTIPLILTSSLQGYSRLAFDLVNYTMPGDGWRPAAGKTDPLFTWLQLAMFAAPILRIPDQVLAWNGFEPIVERFKPFREQIVMQHYEDAAAENLRTGEPIYKPIWWTDYEDFRRGKYDSNGGEGGEDAWSDDRQFMIGDRLLVAAFLLSDDGMMQRMFLPPGMWRNVESQQCIGGGEMVYMNANYNVECFERVLDDSQCVSSK